MEDAIRAVEGEVARYVAGGLAKEAARVAAHAAATDRRDAERLASAIAERRCALLKCLQPYSTLAGPTTGNGERAAAATRSGDDGQPVTHLQRVVARLAAHCKEEDPALVAFLRNEPEPTLLAADADSDEPAGELRSTQKVGWCVRVACASALAADAVGGYAALKQAGGLPAALAALRTRAAWERVCPWAVAGDADDLARTFASFLAADVPPTCTEYLVTTVVVPALSLVPCDPAAATTAASSSRPAVPRLDPAALAMMDVCVGEAATLPREPDADADDASRLRAARVRLADATGYSAARAKAVSGFLDAA